MIPDGTYTAVVDRIEDGQAVLEVDGDDERYELIVDPATIPENGRRQNAVLHVGLVDETIVECEFDATETDSRTSSAQTRFDRLSSRPPKGDDQPE
jgi:hypothetical protein